MIPITYTEILSLIQALGGGIIAPALLVYLILKIGHTNEKLIEQSESLKTHISDSNESHKKYDNKFIKLITFMIRTNGKLTGKAKKELSGLLKI